MTLLFCDVAGSTSLGERLDPGRSAASCAATSTRSRRWSRVGGTVEKFVGDAAMAVFGIPQVHEDDALRAVRAAAEIRERLPAVAAELGVELSFRTGVNTGEVVVGAGQTSPPATPSTSPRASSRPLTRERSSSARRTGSSAPRSRSSRSSRSS